MSLTNAFEEDILQHIFNSTTVIGALNLGFVYVALFTADPTETGSTANEADYTSYARVSVARSGAGWTVSGNTAENAAAVTFPAATGGSNTITHIALMSALTGGTMIWSQAVSSSFAVSSGITPEFAAGAITITAD